MKVLVTGGAGYVGSTLIKRLLEEDDQVVSIDNLTRGDYRFLRRYRGGSDLSLREMDVCDVEEVEERVDGVVHLAAIPGLERCEENPEEAIGTNVYGTYQVLEWARKKGVEKVVFTSSAAVYGVPDQTPITEDQPLKPANLYGVTKMTGEKLAESTSGINPVILRFGNVYGVGVYTYWETVIPKFVDQAWKGQALTVYGNGEQSRDFIHVHDIVQAIISALKGGSGGTFNVGTGKPVSVNNIAHLISRICSTEYDKGVKITHLPPRTGESYLPDFCLSPEKIRETLGFEAQWDLRQGIRQLIEYRSQLA